MYRQLGDSNSQSDEKLPKVPVGGSVKLGRECQIEEVSVGDRLKKFNSWTDDFCPISFLSRKIELRYKFDNHFSPYLDPQKFQT